jgi:hypothetical protein
VKSAPKVRHFCGMFQSFKKDEDGSRVIIRTTCTRTFGERER